MKQLTSFLGHLQGRKVDSSSCWFGFLGYLRGGLRIQIHQKDLSRASTTHGKWPEAQTRRFFCCLELRKSERRGEECSNEIWSYPGQLGRAELKKSDKERLFLATECTVLVSFCLLMFLLFISSDLTHLSLYHTFAKLVFSSSRALLHCQHDFLVLDAEVLLKNSEFTPDLHRGHLLVRVHRWAKYSLGSLHATNQGSFVTKPMSQPILVNRTMASLMLLLPREPGVLEGELSFTSASCSWQLNLTWSKQGTMIPRKLESMMNAEVNHTFLRTHMHTHTPKQALGQNSVRTLTLTNSQ